MNILRALSILINFSAVVQVVILIVQLTRSTYLNQTPNRLLSIVLLGFAVVILNSIRALYDPYLLEDYELFSNTFLLVITPSIYLYISYLTQASVNGLSRRLWHYIPFVVYLFTMIIFISTGKGKNDPTVEMVSNIGFLLFILQNTVYILSSFMLLRKHSAEAKKHYSSLQTASLDWVRKILVSYSVTFVLGTGFAIYQATTGILPDLINLNIVLIYSIHIIVLTYKSLSNPDVYFKKKPYTTSGISGARAEHIYKRVSDLVGQEKLYLQADLTLNKLANQLKVSASSLSQSINRMTGSNFFDFINQFRVDEVKEKLADPRYHHLKLLAIARECGFQSGSVFNAAFRKNTGMKPSEYRKKMMSGYE